MSLATIRAAIVAIMHTVPGIGLVHDRERYAVAQKDFRSFYETGGQVLGWHVRRATTTVREHTSEDCQVVHAWTIRGYMSLNDAGSSEIAFDTLIENLRAAFLVDDTLGGQVHTTKIDNLAGLQVVDSGPVMLAGVLCHGVKLTLKTLSVDDLGDLTAVVDDFATLHADWDIPPHGNVTAPLPVAAPAEPDAEDLIQPETV